MVFERGHAGIPEGKVERSLTENFVSTSDLPSWISTYGAVDRTELHSISEGRGEFELRVSNGEGGIKLPLVDTDSFREVRFGCAMRSDFTGTEEKLAAGFSISQDSFHHSQRAALTTQATRDSSATVQYIQNGTSTETNAHFDLMRGPQIVEIRLRAYEQGFTVAMGSGDDIVFNETNAGYQFDSPVRPMLEITGGSDTPTVLWISKLWFKLYHN